MGNPAVYWLDSWTPAALKRLISSGEKTLNSTARMYTRPSDSCCSMSDARYEEGLRRRAVLHDRSVAIYLEPKC